MGKDDLESIRERRMQTKCSEESRVEVIRLDRTKALDDTKNFLPKEKSASQWTVKDHEVVTKSLRRDKTEKMPKMKKPLVELYQKWKERTPHVFDEMAGPTSDDTCDDRMDDIMMEATKLLDVDEGSSQ